MIIGHHSQVEPAIPADSAGHANETLEGLTELSGCVQLQDISQFGSVADVGALLTPPGVKFLASRKDVVQQPERDTGTVRGKVKAAPQTLYRCAADVAVAREN